MIKLLRVILVILMASHLLSCQNQNNEHGTISMDTQFKLLISEFQEDDLKAAIVHSYCCASRIISDTAVLRSPCATSLGRTQKSLISDAEFSDTLDPQELCDILVDMVSDSLITVQPLNVHGSDSRLVVELVSTNHSLLFSIFNDHLVLGDSLLVITTAPPFNTLYNQCLEVRKQCPDLGY